jgi:undecaprenyl diphosphate synthase
MSTITTNDVTQIYCKDRGAGRPNVFSRRLPFSADAWESQTKKAKNNIPRHVGFIPDGNRRWATDHLLPREAGYVHGINPGLLLFEKCKELGIEEVSIYGFTQDNTKRPSIQKQAFSEACVAFAFEIARRGAALLVVGDETSAQFPKVLTEFRHRQGVGMKVNLLVNYGWEWDLAGLKNGGLRSGEVSRLDLIVRWGGGCRLSGFLPVQSVYADFYVRDEYWPDFDLQHFDDALDWFKNQDQTLGG